MTEMQPFEAVEGQTLAREPLRQAMEALFFVACTPLTTAELAQLLETEEAAVAAIAEELCAEYSEKGFILARVAGGYQFVTPERYALLVQKFYQPKFQQLSAAAMEALAIVAYKQPITRAEVSAIRGVDSDAVMATLQEKKLIGEVGRVAAAGRAVLYGTGEEFLSFFGINSLADLPEMPQEEIETE